MNSAILPIIPEFIRVHLGSPSSDARNVSVPFSDYIKNVASSEIYPTWPEAAIRANILAQISFALNRIYTEYYPAMGYDFDITSTTAFDQSFVEGRDYFENVSRIVDEIFNEYIARRDSVAPLFARYCNGTTSTCEGLSQWGTVPLAEDGLGAYDILTRFYGDDIDLRTAEQGERTESYPGIPLAVGSAGNNVRLLAIRLNRIATNYPAIPKIYPIDGIFDSGVRSSVTEFQRIFNLTPDGIVGKATWYKIISIYSGVKRLSELVSEGLSFDEVSRQFERELREGDSGGGVELVQYYLEVISRFDETIPYPPLDGIFGESTREAVLAFQRTYGLSETGVVDISTFEKLYDIYTTDLRSLPDSVFDSESALPFFGIVLRKGSQEREVTYLNDYLRTVNSALGLYSDIPASDVFGADTERAVKEFQSFAGLPSDGIVSALTWDTIADTYNAVLDGYKRNEGQYPGYDIGGEN